MHIGVQALQDRIENGKYSADDIGFWLYGEPATNTTSNATLLEWWHTLSEQWDSLARHDQYDKYGYPPLALPPGFDFGTQTFDTVQWFIANLFQGRLKYSDTNLSSWEPTWSSFGNYATVDVIQSIYSRNFSGCAASDDHLSCGVRNMAKAMTKTFRDSTYIAHGLEMANVTYGETRVVVSYVRINWFWFSLPLSVWTMAAVLWISTVIHTRRMKVSAWANNILPLLFLYRGDVGKEEVRQEGTSNADYLRKSERIAVQLQFSDGKAKLE
jgi:hypothetical protein